MCDNLDNYKNLMIVLQVKTKTTNKGKQQWKKNK